VRKAIFIKVLVVVVALGAVAGCASTGGGGGDAKAIQNLLTDFADAFIKNDIDKIMAAYSEDFDSPDQGDKAAIREFLGGAIDNGFLEDVEIDTSEMEISIEGDSATVSPVELSAAFGSATFHLTLAKEAGGWKIVTQEIDGI